MSRFIYRVRLAVPVAPHRARAAAGLDDDVGEQQVAIDQHRRDVRDVHRLFLGRRQLRRVVHDAIGVTRPVLEPQVAAAEPAAAEDVLARRTAALRPEDRCRTPAKGASTPQSHSDRPTGGAVVSHCKLRLFRDLASPDRCFVEEFRPPVRFRIRWAMLQPHRCSRGLMPHRAPGSPGHEPRNFLSGKPIQYYRPRGSADVRQLIDERVPGVQRRAAVEACRIFTDKMLAPENDTTIGLTVAGALTPAGLGGCVIELMDRGLSTS